ncbi:MAG: ImmA/IrrE family metallo-endopeptidase [Chloroflexi bacterium]|nr:ImmA/IrrE family metallo-endopeptidase [Chloroflexota bacterium]
MYWISDRTGRFPRRPYYSTDDLDALCEDRIRRFLSRQHGRIAYPISTDDLMVLLEQDADDLDLCADLAPLGGAGVVVEGVTTFVPGGRPRVQIERRLVEDTRRETRLRTTLTHEEGHVLLHAFVGRREAATQLPLLFDAADPALTAAPTTAQCAPEEALGKRRVSWMEWQAGYACGALLMPRTALGDLRGTLGLSAPIPLQRREADRLIQAVRTRFLVSEAAARVRLLQVGYLTETPPPPTLFDAP